MKTMNRISVLAAVAALAAFSAAAFAGDTGSARGGAANLLSPIKTDAPATDAIAMSCPKCKDTVVMVDRASPKGRLEKVALLSHGCPACVTKVAVSGMGRTRTETRTHSCSKAVCGSADLACCATRKGETTPGMEK